MNEHISTFLGETDGVLNVVAVATFEGLYEKSPKVATSCAWIVALRKILTSCNDLFGISMRNAQSPLMRRFFLVRRIPVPLRQEPSPATSQPLIFSIPTLLAGMRCGSRERLPAHDVVSHSDGAGKMPPFHH